ncbi:unnamed protein product [Arctogadus glacialis]
MGGPDGPRPTHCSTGPPKTFLKKIKKYYIFNLLHGSFQCGGTKVSREVFLPLNHVFDITPHVRYSSTPAYLVAKQRKRLMRTIYLLINATNSNYKKTHLVKLFFRIGNIAFNFTSNSLQSITARWGNRQGETYGLIMASAAILMSPSLDINDTTLATKANSLNDTGKRFQITI